MRSLPKLQHGDRVAVLSPSFAAPGFAPAVHEQAMRRLVSELGLVPVELPTTRQLGASPRERARDVNAAFADPEIKAVLAAIGGDDQVRVVPHLDPELVTANPKPFFGYSDNTHLLSWLWQAGVPGFYGGSTQVHLGAGPGIDEVHLASLRAALFEGGELEITEPGESEDFGPDWLSPAALTQYGQREATEPWTWAGAPRVAEARTWGGCLEVVDEIALAGRMPSLEELAGTVLLLETSEELPPASFVRRWLRALGERGVLGEVAALLVARPPVSGPDGVPAAEVRRDLRAQQHDVVLEVMAEYNPEAVVCIGVPFGHTRPQWVLPYGGTIRVDGQAQRITASYD